MFSIGSTTSLAQTLILPVFGIAPGGIESRMEMHLESMRDQVVRIAAAEFELQLEVGETIHTESSYKFTNSTLGALLSDSGFEMEYAWKDERNWYALTLSRSHERMSATRIQIDPAEC